MPSCQLRHRQPLAPDTPARGRVRGRPHAFRGDRTLDLAGTGQICNRDGDKAVANCDRTKVPLNSAKSRPDRTPTLAAASRPQGRNRVVSHPTPPTEPVRSLRQQSHHDAILAKAQSELDVAALRMPNHSVPGFPAYRRSACGIPQGDRVPPPLHDGCIRSRSPLHPRARRFRRSVPRTRRRAHRVCLLRRRPRPGVRRAPTRIKRSAVGSASSPRSSSPILRSHRRR